MAAQRRFLSHPSGGIGQVAYHDSFGPLGDSPRHSIHVETPALLLEERDKHRHTLGQANLLLVGGETGREGITSSPGSMTASIEASKSAIEPVVINSSPLGSSSKLHRSRSRSAIAWRSAGNPLG